MPSKPKFNLNGKTITAPLAAFTMACLLFVYAKTSIHAAKRNAQKHREADGGQISWRNESLRRHGQLEPPIEQGPLRQLAGIAKEKVIGADDRKGETEEERKIRERAGKGRAS